MGLSFQSLSHQLGLHLYYGERGPEFVAGHADKVILALLQFLAGRNIQHKADGLARTLLEDDASHQHRQATAVFTDHLGFKGRMLPACVYLLDRALKES